MTIIKQWRYWLGFSVSVGRSDELEQNVLSAEAAEEVAVYSSMHKKKNMDIAINESNGKTTAADLKGVDDCYY